MGTAPRFVRGNTGAVRARGICTMLVAVVWGELWKHRCTSLRQSSDRLASVDHFGSSPEASSFTTPSRTGTARNRSNHVSSGDVYTLHMLSSTSHTSQLGENSSKPFRPSRPITIGCDCFHHTYLRCTPNTKINVQKKCCSIRNRRRGGGHTPASATPAMRSGHLSMLSVTQFV